MSNSVLIQLEGKELSAVCFVRDYVEFHFDGPILRLLGAIEANTNNDDNLKDQELCSLFCKNIGTTVKSVLDEQPNQLVVVFDGGSIVKVIGAVPGEEYVHYISYPENKLHVWEVE